jgi:hypothetical protein
VSWGRVTTKLEWMIHDGRSLASNATSEASRSADDDDDVPVADPQYGDLLDEQWLERGTDALDPDDDLVDIGLTIDMSDSGKLDEAQGLELDVGALLTSLPAPDAVDFGDAPEREEGAVGIGALQELLLPEEQGTRREDDEDAGLDEHFPAFDGMAAPRPVAPVDDDAEGPHED